MSGHTHSLAEWAQMVSLAVCLYGCYSTGYFVFVDADLADFVPRPVAQRAHQLAVFAGHDLNRAVAAVRHELAPTAVAVRHVAYGGRETARDAAALLILLTTRPQGVAR